MITILDSLNNYFLKQVVHLENIYGYREIFDIKNKDCSAIDFKNALKSLISVYSSLLNLEI